MTATQLATVASIILSLVFSYFPKLNTWYAALEPANKRLIMLGMVLLVSLASFGMSCWSVTAEWVPGLTCDTNSGKSLIAAFIVAIVTNQGVFLISPKTKAVEAVRSVAKLEELKG